MGVTITIGGTDRTSVAPFSKAPNGQNSLIRIEEIVPGSATAHLELWDLTNSVVVNDYDTIVVYDTTNAKNIFQGVVVQRQYDPIATYRKITLDCNDLNALLDTHLVGTPDGTHWTQDTTTGQYTAIDPNAYVLSGSDAYNVAQLFANYWHYPVAIDTSTYVETINPQVGANPLGWDRISLRDALNDIATLSSPQTYFWIDPDAKLHWTNKPQTGTPSGGTSGGVTTIGNLLMLFPQIKTTTPATAPAPYNLSDEPDGTTSIGYENFSVTYDSQSLTRSMYAEGATGYTYTPSSSSPPLGNYIATFQHPTLIYSRHADGCIAQPGWAYGTVGQQVYVNPTYVTPCSSGGGHFWEIKSGTPGTIPNGYLISQSDANVTVVPVQTTPATGTVGVGGSGWVQGGSPSYLSRYVSIPIAQTQAQRDSLGGAALAYSSLAFVRGTADVIATGILYRAGMGLYVTNHPLGLSSYYTSVQKVTTQFLSGTDERRVTIEWGTAPFGTLDLRAQAVKRVGPKKAATKHSLTTTAGTVSAGGTCVITAQMVNAAGEPWAVAGKNVDFSVLVLDSTGADITAATQYNATTRPGGWQLNPSSSMTNAAGEASTQLTTDNATTDADYTVSSSSPD